MYAPIGVSQGHGGSRVYNLSQSKTLPEFMAEALKENKSLRKNKEFKERLEVIQGFEFSTSCAKVVISEDRRYVGAIGMYPPDLKVYDTQDLSMKFQRRFDSEPLDLLFLTTDYRKLVTLQTDRFLEFHDQGGRHHRMRLPSYGRQLKYNSEDAELIITGSDIYRLDLSEGKFKESFRSQHEEPSVSTLANSLLYVGGDKPIVEIYDSRASVTPVGRVDLGFGDTRRAATAIVSDSKSHLALGDDSGVVSVYDMRAPSVRSICDKQHSNYGPIRDLHFVTVRNDVDKDWAIASADSWQVRVWRPTSDKIDHYATFEAQGKINSICPYPDSGLIFLAQDYQRVGVHFLPALGLAPPWSPFIDQVVNDFNDSENVAGFGEYDFLTHADLNKHGIQVSDSRLRPYQHGFVISSIDHRAIIEAYQVLDEPRLRRHQLEQNVTRHYAKNPLSLNNISGHFTAVCDATNRELAPRKFDSLKSKVTKNLSALEDSRFAALIEL